jgi:hypothetical protein
MAQGRRRQPFEMPFTFSLNNILSIVADHLSKKALLEIYRFPSVPPFFHSLYSDWIYDSTEGQSS